MVSSEVKARPRCNNNIKNNATTGTTIARLIILITGKTTKGITILAIYVAYVLGKNAIDRQTDMDGPKRCSLLTLKREENLKTHSLAGTRPKFHILR
jgi:hypothetical protein